MNKFIDIKGYEWLYKINKRGEILSCEKIRPLSFGKPRVYKEKLLKARVWGNGYRAVVLYKEKKAKVHTIHRLLATHYIDNENNKPYVNHIDGDRLNNKLENLEWVTPKENSLKTNFSRGSSKYRGVSLNKQTEKWCAFIQIDGKNKNLGSFDNEKDAYEVYIKKREEVLL